MELKEPTKLSGDSECSRISARAKENEEIFLVNDVRSVQIIKI